RSKRDWSSDVCSSDLGDLAMSTETFKRLHSIIQKGANDAGQWKRINNDIVELQAGKPPRVRFRPVPFEKTAAAVEELCLSYQHRSEERRVGKECRSRM